MQSRLKILGGFIACFSLMLLGATTTLSQDIVMLDKEEKSSAATPLTKGSAERPEKSTNGDTERINTLEDTLRVQSAQLDELRKMVAEQQQTIQLLATKLTSVTTPGATAGLASAATSESLPGSSATQGSKASEEPPALEKRLAKVEDRVTKIGPFKFSGDFRLRFDGIFRSASEPPDPPLTHVQNARARYRLRLNFDTDLYPNLSFHGQLATGPINNSLTLDQDFSATTVRHPFFLSEAWIDYHPNKAVQLQAGRVQEVFADNTRFLFDDDIRFNGFNEKYAWSLKKKPLGLSSIEFRAGQYILSNPNVAIIAPGSPLANAGQIVGTTGRSANLFHQGMLFNQQFNKKWSDQFGGDVQLYRNPNQIALASTAEGLTLLIQPGLGLALSGPLPGTGTATTTPGGAIYSARSFKIARLTYRLTYAGFKQGDHTFPVTFNFQFARNMGTGLDEREALLAAVQLGKITKRGDTSYLYVYAQKGANSMISQVTDDDLGTVTGVNTRTNYFRFEYGLAKKVTFQSLFFFQNQLKNSGAFPRFFVPLGEFAPRTFRMQQQLAFSF
jgi:putative porin